MRPEEKGDDERDGVQDRGREHPRNAKKLSGRSQTGEGKAKQ